MATSDITTATENARRQTEQLARARQEQAGAAREMAATTESIARRFALITRANQAHLATSTGIAAQGGLVYTEAEESRVVYGMPRAVVEAGLSDKTVPLDEMAASILAVV